MCCVEQDRTMLTARLADDRHAGAVDPGDCIAVSYYQRSGQCCGQCMQFQLSRSSPLMVQCSLGLSSALGRAILADSDI